MIDRCLLSQVITKISCMIGTSSVFVKQQTTQENPGPSSPRRRGSPRQTGRGSPGARISWLTAAKSGVGGQVMLNEKGKERGRCEVFSGVQLYWLVLDKGEAMQKGTILLKRGLL